MASVVAAYSETAVVAASVAVAEAGIAAAAMAFVAAGIAVLVALEASFVVQIHSDSWKVEDQGSTCLGHPP